MRANRKSRWYRLPTKVADGFIKEILTEGTLLYSPNVRISKRPCPVCKYKKLLVTKRRKGVSGHSGAIHCVRCHIILPADCIYSVKTNRLVRF